MAIGNPFNLSHTVTVGVISALGRPFGVAQREQPMLQTDAAINPGNSGGPLLNIRGEVVGMNTAIYTDQRSANIGIGFATPINAVRDLLPQLRTGKVVRGVIGIQVSRDPLTSDVAEAMGLSNTNGALVSGVADNQPAAKAGMQPGDVIVEFNGRPVKDSDALVSMVVATKPGTTVPVTVVRDKQRKALNVTVSELDLEAEAGRVSRARPDTTDEPTATGLGMDIGPITPDIARELEIPRERGGAVVTGVDRNSPAFNAGIAPGDVILEVNRTAVTSPTQVQRELQKVQPGAPVFLLLWRNGAESFVTVRKR
jgi:serine protease Do